MQAGGGCRYRSALAGEDGLVALTVASIVAALDVGRQRDVADSFELFVEIARGAEAHGPFPEFASCDDFGVERIGKPDALAHSHLASGTDQGRPIPAVSADGPQEKDFDFAAQVL